MSSGRGWTLRRHIGVAFVAIAVVSLVIVGVLGYAAARTLLTDEVNAQLTGLHQSRVRSLETGVERYRARMSTLAVDRTVVEAVGSFGEAMDELDDPGLLDASEQGELDAFYDATLANTEVVDRLTSAGLDVPPLADAIPTNDAARYLQYHYVVQGDGPATVDAGDGSSYSAVHARLHPFLADAAAGIGLDDLLIVSADTGRVVYSVEKRVDLGADVIDGPLGETSLHDVLTEQLARARSGETVMVDFAPYLGAGGAPVLFAATQVRDGSEVVGAIVGSVPIDAVNTLMTAGGQWSDIGLGETGETYLVGGDRLLRSDSRLWLEDPDAYAAAAADEAGPETVAAITATGSTVLLQDVDTEPVRVALDGDTFVGAAVNYLGRRTMSVAAGVHLAELDWVVVADVGTDEANAALDSYIARVLVAALIILSLVVIVAIALARRLAGPIRPLTAAAAAVAEGDRDPDVDDVSDDEFGHLGRSLRQYADALAVEEARLADAEHEIDEMLLAVMPARAVDPIRRGELELSDCFDSATIAILTLTQGDDAQGDEAELEQLSELVNEIEVIANDRGLERVHASSNREVFVAGVGRDGEHADDAVRFALAARQAVERFSASSGADIAVHAVLSSGSVAMGVVGVDQLSFGVWGEPARRALELDTVARGGQILLDRSVADGLGGEWRFAAVDEQPTLGRQRVDALELVSAPPIVHDRTS